MMLPLKRIIGCPIESNKNIRLVEIDSRVTEIGHARRNCFDGSDKNVCLGDAMCFLVCHKLVHPSTAKSLLSFVVADAGQGDWSCKRVGE